MINENENLISLEVNGAQNSLGIDTEHPVFHYFFDNLEISDGELEVELSVKDETGVSVWESGIISGNDVPYIKYTGKPLKSKTGYTVNLRAVDKKNKKEYHSEEKYFETGFLNEGWEASWIEPLQEPAVKTPELKFFELFAPREDFFTGAESLKECQDLRRSFNISKKVKKARIYASAHGVYILKINGKDISKKRLAPEVSAYQKILYYQTYDVTDFLDKGENVISATLGDGWWIGRLGLSGDSCQYGEKLGFIMEMDIEYTDGTLDKICSDGDFKNNKSYIKYSDLYIGEKQDLTQESYDWQKPGYDDRNWTNCGKVEYDRSNLTAQRIDSVKIIKKVNTVKIFRTPNHELVADFGQVLAGVIRINFDGKSGELLSFEHSEVLDKDGNFKNNIIGRFKNQKDEVISRDGVQTFEPKFTFHGFRYVKINGLDESQILSLEALVLGTPLYKTGSFQCSDSKLNQLQHNIEWSTIGNMLSIPTDCPQREKLGWTGDIQVFAKTGCFNFDLKNFLESWLMNLRAEQKENGEVPIVVPNFPLQERLQVAMSGSNCSSAWSDACVLVPYYLYTCYGDIQVLKDNYITMEKWLSYVEKQAAIQPEGFEEMDEAAKARNKFLWTKGYHFGDWLIPSLRALPDGIMKGSAITGKVVGSCFYAITVNFFLEVCKALGYLDKIEEYSELLINIKNSIAEEFVAEDGTVNDSDLQGLYVVVLKAEAVKSELKNKVLDKLVNLIKANGYCLDTGFASVSYLLDVLYDNGFEDVAYKILFQTKAPSWLYMVENGATTMWENWVAVTPEGVPTDSSYNHYAFGCVGDWIYRHIGGIQIKEAGYKEVIINPDYNCGLSYSKCHVDSPFGKISCSWEINSGKTKLEVSVPNGVTARIYAGDQIETKTSGKYVYNF